eukprot:CAMPEP_0203662558 /NCGR_PEP_ID=MMETSP0090-20130426/482_1 /ASSEMBLY_ACC=CAM_ASM_001088 /TAXON_ID=426623 /ORGANISM="Chaetoceros affinis, Strain CCMP159" /LENGTH=426 /DNA_ID=CAMNT_0050525363 /DNA_START=147 /DNA_END=1427 /DNA_ORIENTATION=-
MKNQFLQSQQAPTSIEKADIILQLLLKSGVKITPDLLGKLPSVEDFTKLYGSEPKIIGLDTCKAFQNNIKKTDAAIGPVGVYNSGTTLLHSLLKKHCVIQERVDAFDDGSFSDRPGYIITTMDQGALDGMRTGIFNDVPWGKHGPMSWREDKQYRPNTFHINEAYPEMDYNNVFPIVIVKDPYHWMESMLRHPYNAVWYHSPYSELNLNEEYDIYDAIYDLNGPNQKKVRRRWSSSSSSSSRGGMKFAVNRQKEKRMKAVRLNIRFDEDGSGRLQRFVEYDDFVDLWNTFYNDYWNATFPRLIVRYEDLLLHANEIIPQICRCVDGKLVNTTENGVTLSQESVKDVGRHGKTSNLVQSLMRYGNETLRTRHFSKGDLVYADEYLRQDLMEIFGYSDPDVQFEDEGKPQGLIIQSPRKEEHMSIDLH